MTNWCRVGCARRTRYRLAIPEQRTRLLRELAERTDFRQVRFVAPAADPLYVERAAPLVALKAALLDPNGDPLPATVALHGPAGYGKTALAERLARDPAIREAFCDGILHVQLGRDLGSGQAREDRVKGLLLDLIGKIIGAPPPHFEGLQNAREELATVLDNSVRLIVIDNAWTRGDVEPFLRFGSEDAAARLITTRDLAALPAEATVVEVDEMEPGEARTMVRRGLNPAACAPLADRLDTLAWHRLGAWPLLLDLANGHLREFSRSTELTLVLDNLNSALGVRGVAHGFDPETLPLDPEAARTLVWETLRLSLDRLPGASHERAMNLAVFAEDARITLDAAARLWDIEPWEAERLTRTLRRLALVRDFDGTAMILHNAIRRVLGDELGDARLGMLHQRLIQNCRVRFGSDWRQLTDDYTLRHLSWHMSQTGDAGGIETLLLDPTWMMAKLAGPGFQSLIEDYLAGPDSSEGASTLVERTLRLIAGTLANHPAELCAQLRGRLGALPDKRLVRLVDRVATIAPPGCLSLARSTLISPGPELMRLDGHASGVYSLVAMLDGRLVSGSLDGSIRVWDLAQRKDPLYLDAHSGGVNSVAALPDGRVVSGGEDSVVRVWDLGTGTEVKRFEGHSGAVTSVAVLSDGRVVSGGRDGTVRIWDLMRGLEIARMSEHKGWVSCVVVLPRALVVSGGQDRAVRIWDPVRSLVTTCPRPRTGRVYSLAVMLDGRILSGNEGVIRIWDPTHGVAAGRFRGQTGWVFSLAVLTDGRVVSGGGDGTIYMWDPVRRVEISRLSSVWASIVGQMLHRASRWAVGFRCR